MKEIGLKIGQMDLAYINLKKLNMKVNGNAIDKKELEQKYGQMELLILENSKKVKKLEMENLNI